MFLWVSFPLEDMGGGWRASRRPHLALMQHGLSLAGSSLQHQPKSLSCWDRCQGWTSTVFDVGARCLEVWHHGYCSEIQCMTSHSPNFKQPCGKSVKVRHVTCSALVSSACWFRLPKSEVLLGICAHSERSQLPGISPSWQELVLSPLVSVLFFPRSLQGH